MKRLLAVLLMGTLLVSMVGCSNANTTDATTEDSATPTQETESAAESESEAVETETEQPESDTADDGTGSNTLIAYFSRAGENYGVGVIEKGNTEILAEMIAEETGADLFKIETVEPYPESYDECTEVAQQELSENARPEITGTVENMSQYENLVIMYPIWWGDLPMAEYTFLESYDFTEKTIIPICTHAGSGLGSTPENIAEVCSGADVRDGYEMSGETAQNDQDTARETVKEWVAELGL